MRLIDVDAIDDDTLYAYGFFTDGYDVREMLANQPTVDAVPVSLIQSEIDFLRLAAEGELEMTGRHGETRAELFALEHLLSVWENEKRKQHGTD